MIVVELLAEGVQLPSLEGRDLVRAPTFGSADHRADHELHHRLLAEGVGDDPQAPPLFDKQPLEEVGVANRPAKRNRQPQMGDAGLEVVPYAGDRTRQFGLVVVGDALGQVACDRPAWCLVGRLDPGLEFRPLIVAELGREIAHARGQPALAGRGWKADFAERGCGDPAIPQGALMMPGAPSLTTSNGSPGARKHWKNATTVSASSFEPGIKPKRTFLPSEAMPQPAITGSRFCPERMRSAMPSMKRSLVVCF